LDAGLRIPDSELTATAVEFAIRNSEFVNYQLIELRSAYLQFQGHRFHYRIMGEGGKVTLCFHGFGEYAQTFESLAQILPGHRLVAIDLPFHGETAWEVGLPFRPEDLQALILQIPEVGAASFGLMGYSIGGRVAMAQLERMPERISHLLLLAPDGLTVNPWYALATRTVMGNRIFKYTMDRPGWFRQMVHLGTRLKLVNASVEKYVERYIGEPDRRRELYRVWTVMSGFRPSVSRVAAIIREKSIPTQLVFGKYDRIIPPTVGRILQQQAGDTCHTTILDTGHGLLHRHQLSALSTIFQALASIPIPS
jgi:pimeloyl-ACP methyl ester carboxylesterase